MTAAMLEMALPACSSCGDPAAVVKWTADPAQPRVVLCGRDALLMMGASAGVVADIVLGFGAARA